MYNTPEIIFDCNISINFIQKGRIPHEFLEDYVLTMMKSEYFFFRLHYNPPTPPPTSNTPSPTHTHELRKKNVSLKCPR